jgi:hypothetical protein
LPGGAHRLTRCSSSPCPLRVVFALPLFEPQSPLERSLELRDLQSALPASLPCFESGS